MAYNDELIRAGDQSDLATFLRRRTVYLTSIAGCKPSLIPLELRTVSKTQRYRSDTILILRNRTAVTRFCCS